MTDNHLMQVKSIAEYIIPALSYHLYLRPLFLLILSGHLSKVWLYRELKWL